MSKRHTSSNRTTVKLNAKLEIQQELPLIQISHQIDQFYNFCERDLPTIMISLLQLLRHTEVVVI